MRPRPGTTCPTPDAVFVGGSGRGISRLVDDAYGRLRPGGRLVATMSSIDNLAETHRTLHARCPDMKVWMVNLARGNCQMERLRFEAAQSGVPGGGGEQRHTDGVDGFCNCH